ncbi:MAG: hypothetical protein R2726_11385 [Acidimicrobiales bacterium]
MALRLRVGIQLRRSSSSVSVTSVHSAALGASILSGQVAACAAIIQLVEHEPEQVTILAGVSEAPDRGELGAERHDRDLLRGRPATSSRMPPSIHLRTVRGVTSSSGSRRHRDAETGALVTFDDGHQVRLRLGRQPLHLQRLDRVGDIDNGLATDRCLAGRRLRSCRWSVCVTAIPDTLARSIEDQPISDTDRPGVVWFAVVTGAVGRGDVIDRRRRAGFACCSQNFRPASASAPSSASSSSV